MRIDLDRGVDDYTISRDQSYSKLFRDDVSDYQMIKARVAVLKILGYETSVPSFSSWMSIYSNIRKKKK